MSRVLYMMKLLLPFFLLVGTVVGALPARADDKLKPEDLVAKHLESIGNPAANTYKFHLSIQSEVRPAVVDWVFTLNNYSFTSPLDAAEFTFGEKK